MAKNYSTCPQALAGEPVFCAPHSPYLPLCSRAFPRFIIPVDLQGSWAFADGEMLCSWPLEHPCVGSAVGARRAPDPTPLWAAPAAASPLSGLWGQD